MVLQTGEMYYFNFSTEEWLRDRPDGERWRARYVGEKQKPKEEQEGYAEWLREAEGEVRALGWEMDAVCFSTVKLSGRKHVEAGSKGRLIGPSTSDASDKDERVLVEFEDGTKCNVLAKTEIETAEQREERVSDHAIIMYRCCV